MKKGKIEFEIKKNRPLSWVNICKELKKCYFVILLFVKSLLFSYTQWYTSYRQPWRHKLRDIQTEMWKMRIRLEIDKNQKDLSVCIIVGKICNGVCMYIPTGWNLIENKKEIKREMAESWKEIT
jgi:hypothetical protein